MDLPTFEQLMTNLIVNARDAMRGGGKVTLTLQRMNQKSILTLRDTGLGMDSATCQRVFEPFFSTKGPSGTGLGLSIVFGAVKRAGGTIHVESKPGAGTTFTLEFPIQGIEKPT
jgi:signal transduction histidine kinase